MDQVLDFLRTRLDETGLARLTPHSPQRMGVAYLEPHRVETRVAMFTGCVTCSRVPVDRLFASYRDIDIEVWPCLRVRELAAGFADDPDHASAWGPEHAAYVGGRPVTSPPVE